MKNKRAVKKINRQNIVTIFLAIFGIILIFSFFDYLIHLLKETFAVPGYYFRNKIIFGTIWGFIVYLLIRTLKISMFVKSLIFSAAISIVLQFRYYLEGYPKDFVFLFLEIHFVILFIVSLVSFKLIEKFKL